MSAAADEGDIGNPIVSLAVSAAIAYTDALSARFGGSIGHGEHTAAVKVLRDALGTRLPDAQEKTLRRILTQKDLAQYGPRAIPMAECGKLLDDLDRFAAWAEAEFDRRQ